MLLTLIEREKYYQRFQLVHALMLTILGAYTLLGAICFCALEAPNERVLNARRVEEARAKQLSARNTLHNEINKIVRRAGGSQVPSDRFADALDVYEKSLLESFQLVHNRSGKSQNQQNVTTTTSLLESTPKWTLWGGLYYVLTTYTTIGYGDIVAETPAGRLLTIAYALVGIPLVLTVLNVWGGGLFRLTAHAWRALARCCCGAEFLSQSAAASSATSKQRRLLEGRDPTNATPTTPRFDDDAEWPKRAADVPLKFAFFLLVLWVLFSAALFAALLHWDYFDAAYFFFVSLTTIGYGDYTIEHSVACAYFILVFAGLSVVSMSINAIQARIEFVYNLLAGSIEDDFKQTLLASSPSKQPQKLEHKPGGTDRPPPISSLIPPQHHGVVGIARSPSTPLPSPKPSPRATPRQTPRPSPRPSPLPSPASSRQHIALVVEGDDADVDDKDAVRRFSRNLGVCNRILVRMMNEHLQRLLNKRWMERKRMRNAAVQTRGARQNMSAQTDFIKKGLLSSPTALMSEITSSESDDDDDNEANQSNAQKHRRRASVIPLAARKMYIYNVGD